MTGSLRVDSSICTVLWSVMQQIEERNALCHILARNLFFLTLAKLDGANAAGASTRYTRFTG